MREHAGLARGSIDGRQSPRPSDRAVRAAGAGHHARPAEDRRRPAQGVRTASTAPSTPRRRWRVDGRRAAFRRRPAGRPAASGFAQPGAAYPTIVRFSNAAGSGQPDYKPDLRGVALRIEVAAERAARPAGDQLSRVARARRATSSSTFAMATAGGTAVSARSAGSSGSSFTFGPSETIRMLRNVAAGRRRKVGSVALRDLLEPRRDPLGRHARRALPAASRRPGRAPAPRAVRRPTPTTCPTRSPAGSPPATSASSSASSATSTRSRRRSRTPPSNGPRRASPPSRWPMLTIAEARPRGRRRGVTDARVIDELAFNPWNTTDEFRPLGNLNRARKVAYDASAAHRLRLPLAERGPPLRNRRPRRRRACGCSRSSTAASSGTGCRCGSACSTSTRFRHVLRRANLIDTEVARGAAAGARRCPPPPGETDRVWRAASTARYNDLSDAEDGRGRLDLRPQPAARLPPGLFDEPNPVTVSRELLHREAFHAGALAQPPGRRLDPVPGARLGQPRAPPAGRGRRRGAAAGRHDRVVEHARGRAENGDAHRRQRGARRRRTAIARRSSSATPASHWWDGSEVYGADGEKRAQARATAPSSGCRERLPAPGRPGLRDHRLQRELVAGPQRPAHAVRARAQPARATSCARTTGAGTTSASTRRRG